MDFFVVKIVEFCYNKIKGCIVWTNEEKYILPLTLGIIIITGLVLCVLLRNKREKIKNIPLVTITIIMLVMEVIKQVISFKEGYDLWTIPLHFCSLFLYFYPLATLTKGKVKEFGVTMAFVSSCLMTALFYFNPSSIISESASNVFGSFSNFHTFIYHHLVMLFLFTGLLLNMFKVSKKSFVHVLIGFSAYALIAIPLAHVLDTNYCNILTSNIGFMENLRLNAGQIIYTIVMFLFAISASFVLILIKLGITKLRNKK